jgi:hypothetical protein
MNWKTECAFPPLGRLVPARNQSMTKKTPPTCSGIFALAICTLFHPSLILAQELVTDIPGLTERGQRDFRPVPDLTKGGKPDDKHDWTLGPTGLRGWMWAMRLQTTLARQILVTEVEQGSPADGKIEVGDVILGVGGDYFRDDARKAFGRAITEAEKEENRGILKIKRWRDGKTEDVAIPIGVMGSYSALSPIDCPKSARILDKACQVIARRGLKKNIPGYVNALGLLASGDPQYLPMVRDFCRSLDPLKDTRMSSWHIGYMNILLSEYYLLTRDEEVLPEIRDMALFFAKGQSFAGTWGHANAGPDGIIMGYGAMSQPSLSVAVSLQLNQKCGVDDPVIAEAIGKTDIFFTTHVDKGSIPYGDGIPDVVHDSNGRSSLAVIFFDLLDRPKAYDYWARMTIASYLQREEGHTGNYWGMLWGPLGAMRAGPEATAAFLREMHWFYDLERRWDGSFIYQGGAGMSGPEHTTPGWDTTGARVLMYAMNLRKLYITGRGQKEMNALTGERLARTLEAGADYSVWVREGKVDIDAWDQLGTEELFEKLVTWSTPQRIRAADALARKDQDIIPRLMKLLQSDDRETLLGAIYGLTSQKAKAAPAIDRLVELMQHDDLWIRFRAGYALCAIGPPAREKAVPVMLELATRAEPNDPRQMNQRYMSFLLWGGGVNREPIGLLRKNLEGVDPDALNAAIRSIIANPNGQARMLVARCLNRMSEEQLKPLWPKIIWAVKNPARSGIMFNADIRETGAQLLTEHRYRQGVQVIATYIKTMKPHGSEKRIVRLMDLLASYGEEAKVVLPDLYEARAYYVENLGPGKKMHFPQWATEKFFEGFDEGIKAIEQASGRPEGLRDLDGS